MSFRTCSTRLGGITINRLHNEGADIVKFPRRTCFNYPNTPFERVDQLCNGRTPTLTRDTEQKWLIQVATDAAVLQHAPRNQVSEWKSSDLARVIRVLDSYDVLIGKNDGSGVSAQDFQQVSVAQNKFQVRDVA